MKTTRRTALATFGLAGLLPLCTHLVNATAASAETLVDGPGEPDFARLRARWVDMLTGRDAIVASDPDFEAALGVQDAAVAQALASLESSSDSTAVFSDLPFDTSSNVTATIRRIAVMATAWATPGSGYFADHALGERTVAALRTFNLSVYNDQSVAFGNWWDWSIGASRAQADVMVLLHAEIDAGLMAKLNAGLQHFVQIPSVQPRGGGANAVDMVQALCVTAVAVEDATLLRVAMRDLASVWHIVTAGDGFYPDYSFIQHGTLAYAGSYGVVLLTGLSKLFSLLAGTDVASDDPQRQNLYVAVERTFAPLIYNGQMLDCVRGRAVSRQTEPSRLHGYNAIVAILTLAQGAESSTAARWQSMCKGWLERDSVGDPLRNSSVLRVATFKRLSASTAAPTQGEPVGHVQFPLMNRAVHRGSGFALVVSLSSSRIAWYECGNGENNLGAQQGSGKTYLYGDDQAHYDDSYWATVNHSRYAGITVDTTPTPPKVEGEWGTATPRDGVVMMASDGSAGVVGQYLVGPGEFGVKARKSWFFAGDVMVALGADIVGSSDSTVETIVEHRNLGSAGSRPVHVSAQADAVGGEVVRVAVGSQVVSQVGSEVGSEVGLPWAHVADTGGYVSLDGAPFNAVREVRSGSWSANNAKGSTEVVARPYATLWFDHGVRPRSASYAYAVLPGASLDETREFEVQHAAEVLANDASVQAVAWSGGMLAANFWAPGRVGRFAVEQPASLLCVPDGRGLTLVVGDPSGVATEVVVRIHGAGWRRVSDGGSLSVSRGVTTVVIDVRESLGQSRSVTLSK